MSPLLLTHRQHSLPFRNLISLLICLLAVSTCISRVEGHNTPLCASSNRISPDAVAFGFDLGQSYGTSVARFENGTTIPLAKIRGNATYTALMECLLPRPETHWLPYIRSVRRCWLSPFRAIKQSLNLAPAYESAVLAEMVAALKTASETALQIQVEAVAVTAPWMAAWDKQWPSTSVINNALLLVGLEPRPTSWWDYDENYYLGQTNTVLASEGRWACKKHWCAGHWMYVEGEAASGGSVFFVSFTNHSLYTSFQPAGCYFFNSWGNHLASIDALYGLEKESQAASPAQFWSELKAHLLSLIKQHATRQGRYCLTPFTVLLAGEAAGTAEFLDVMHDIVQDIPGLCASKSKTTEWGENGEAGQVELVIPDDLTYGAAKGAAIWLRTMMNYTYCAEEGIVDQYDMIGEIMMGDVIMGYE